MEPPSPKEVDLDASSLAHLASSGARALLDTIDGLRQLGVGEIVDLPQIIVVGDQSAGKSSVLEAISRVRFPVDGDLCTRFATELILRRSAETALQVTIQYADEASSITQRGGAQPQPFQRQSFDKDALPDIIKEAQELMGISKGGAKNFSKDILRVEIAAPDLYPLTLVDLPGIFHSATADQDLRGKAIVDQLIESYMKQPKSIILAVVAANNQLANQLVLQQARQFDPLKERTIGVITKPDLAGPGSSNERKYLDLARGRESMHKLALGWYVLRNRSEEERTSGAGADDRDAKEERFFRTSAWDAVSRLNRGVECLRKKLSKVLLDHIKGSLPDMIQEIEVKLSECQEELSRLGKSRSSPDELRSYLHGIAGDFQRLARDAVDGRYNDEFFGGIAEGEKNALKLRAVLRNLSRAFYAIMEMKGARYEIVEEDMADDGEDDEGEHEDGSSNESVDRIQGYLRPYIDAYKVPEPEVITESRLNDRLLSYAAANQGRELPGMPSGELVLQLFKENAERWPEIARTHLEQVLEKTEEFVVKAFDHIIGADQSTADAIWSGLLEPFFHEKKEVLQSKLQELLLPYTNGRSFPPEREFIAAVSKRTRNRLADRVADHLAEHHPQLFQADHKGRLSRSQLHWAIVDQWEESESSEFGTEKVLDMMIPYYEICARTFMDNVANLAVESCLVSDVENILTARKVDAMSVDTLKELASESEETRMNRTRLENEVRILREGLRKCQKHKPRTTAASSHLSVSDQAQSATTAGTPSRSPTPLGHPAPPPAAATKPQPATPAAPAAATGSGSFSASTNFAKSIFSSSPGQAGGQAPPVGDKGTAFPAPPGTGLFSNLRGEPTPFRPKASTSSFITRPVSSFDSNNNLDSNNKQSGGKDQGAGSFPNTNSKLETLKYPGMEAVPMLQPATTPSDWFHIERGPSSRGFGFGQPCEQIYHLCSAPRLKGFSIEELRLKWMVEQAASN